MQHSHYIPEFPVQHCTWTKIAENSTEKQLHRAQQPLQKAAESVTKKKDGCIIFTCYKPETGNM